MSALTAGVRCHLRIRTRCLFCRPDCTSLNALYYSPMGSPSVGCISLDRFKLKHVGIMFSGLFWVCCVPCQVLGAGHGMMCWLYTVLCVYFVCVDCDRGRNPAERHGAGQRANGAALLWS
jgi:hypothetical protein